MSTSPLPTVKSAPVELVSNFLTLSWYNSTAPSSIKLADTSVAAALVTWTWFEVSLNTPVPESLTY